MDTNRIKRFATEARTRLKEGIAAKIITLGFDKKGNVKEELKPQLMQGGTLWNGQLLPESFFHQWTSLYNRVQQKGVNEVYEEAAYTWFNRLCAIRILQKNNLCAPVFHYADSARTPLIVDEARQGRLPQMREEVRARLMELLDDDTKVTEQFAVLISAWCHDNPIINSCFGQMADYTELLLPNNILAENGFVDMLNHTEFITDENFRSPELIGWLYQFYISERKDEVFAKKGKFEADEIPAATQIFTPNWIVKYMVQNTVGRIYLDNNPGSDLGNKMPYLVEKAEGNEDAVYHYDQLEDLRVIDPACGSGHILLEAFDLLYTMYIDEFYTRREAIENIFKYNLVGIDLDTRARQLATFALLLKACQRDDRFLDAHCLPQVLDMSNLLPSYYANLRERLPKFLQTENEVTIDEVIDAYELMEQAGSLGSIMRFDISAETRQLLVDAMLHWKETDNAEMQKLFPGVRLILALTEKYAAVIANPPYMGAGNMNKELSDYAKKKYPTTKQDLFSMFMERMIDMTEENARAAFITMESWMFLSSFEKFRKNILDNYFISSLGHFGWHIIGIAFGTAMTIIEKSLPGSRIGEYSYLTIEDIDREKNVPYVFPKKDNGRFAHTSQKNFEKIPGSPIGYWVSPKIQEIFTSNLALSAVASPCVGLQTADNARFLRLWFEVCQSCIGFGFENAASAARSQKKWFPYNKGGNQRRWYGNQTHVVNWENDGEEIKNFKGAVVRNPTYYFKPSLSWSDISSSSTSFKIYPKGFIFDVCGMSCFDIPDTLNLLGILNTNLFPKIIRILNPTMHFQIGNFKQLPSLSVKTGNFNSIVSQNVTISQQDWDAHETSWDFQRNELLNMDGEVMMANLDYMVEQHFKKTGEHICIDPAAPCPDSIEWCIDTYKQKWERLFEQLHANEEELNRQFIDIYGLQDELTPDVPLDEVTILQQGEISFLPAPGSSNGEPFGMEWNDAVIIKQFISYAIGCMMGRYSLDKPGLILANQGDTLKEYLEQVPSPTFMPDEDGILPLMTSDCGFSDNAPLRLADFVRSAFGEHSQVENLNYIEKCLGKPIEQYFVKDFWKDHKKMYQNRPIYWLFASKKGAFQVIAYMHRMNAYTVERIRAKYLLPYIENVQAKIADLDNRRASLTTKETKQLQQLQKTLDECREYHDRLQVVAEQAIAFDLDDGVVVNHAKFGDVVQKLK